MSSNRTSAANTTVVVWDASAAAAHALDWGIQRARDRGGEFVLAMPSEPFSTTMDRNSRDRAVVDARFDLEGHVVALRHRFPQLSIVGTLLDGDLYQELTGLSDASTLVVVGTHDRRQSSFAFARSVGGRLAAMAHGPVAIIPESAPIRFDGILVGIDGSASALAAAEFAAREAVERHVDLTMLHAWQEPMAWQDVYARPDDEFVRELEEAHRQVLDDAVAVVEGQYPSLVVQCRLVRGTAPWALLDAAGASQLLIVGTRGLHGVKKFVLGSVSHSLVLNLRSAAVIVPTPAVA